MKKKKENNQDIILPTYNPNELSIGRERERELKEMIGEQQFNDLIKYTFEMSCQESTFLRLDEFCVNDLEKKVAFNRLCRMRRQIMIDETWESCMNIKYLALAQGNTDPSFELSFDYSKIPDVIKHRYFKITRP